MENASYSNRLFAAVVDSFLASALGGLLASPLIIWLVYLFASTEELVNCFTDTGCDSLGSGAALLAPVLILIIGLVFVAVSFFYYVYRPSKKNGQTYGKKYFNIRVVNEDGTEVTLRTMFIRGLLWLIFQEIGLIPILIDKNRRSLYDMFAKTRVIEA